MIDRQKNSYNAFIDIMTRMIGKYGPKVLEELEKNRTLQLS